MYGCIQTHTRACQMLTGSLSLSLSETEGEELTCSVGVLAKSTLSCFLFVHLNGNNNTAVQSLKGQTCAKTSTRQTDLTDSTSVRLHWRLLLPGLSLLSTSPCWGLTFRWWNLFFWARRWVLSLDVENIPTSKKRAAQITAKGFNNEPQHDVYVWFYHGCLLTRNESSNKSLVAATPALEKTHYVMQPKYILN